MVNNFIDGIYASVTRINPETLSLSGRAFLKALREDIKNRRTIDKNLGNLIVKHLIKYHNDTGESLLPLLTEMVTISFFAIDPHRKYFIKVTEFVIFGAIFTALTITDENNEINDLIIQTMIAILTNPIYEFTAVERVHVARLVMRIEGYLKVLNRFTHRFTEQLPLIDKSLEEGLVQGLEICNATADEINNASSKKYTWDFWLGGVYFILYLCWPMFNITTHVFIKWLNSKTGIEIWPEKTEHVL